MRRFLLAVSFLLASTILVVAQNRPLTVLDAGPTGEITQRSDASEIRVIFSEPMIALGRTPANPQIPWVSITPRMAGQFRWSGTSILLFTPDPAAPLPDATTYTVTIDAAATSAAGRRLDRPYTFRFTTPTVKLLGVEWYRRDGRVDRPVVLALRFNQRVRATDLLAHLSVRREPHTWEPPAFSDRELARLRAGDPGGLAAFETKVAATRRAASADTVVPVRSAAEWDRDRFPDDDAVVVVETTAALPPETWLRVAVDARMPSPAGPALPADEQTSTVALEPAFFAQPMDCRDNCDPSAWNGISFTGEVAATEFSRALGIRDITTTPETPVSRAPDAAPAPPSQTAYGYNVESAGFERQPPARTWRLRLDPSLTALDGQSLGYTWIAIVDNEHEQAFVSFGDGHGVWERSGGPVLPFSSRNFTSVTQWLQRLTPDTLMPTLRRLQEANFRTAPETPGAMRQLPVTPDAIQAHGLNLSSVLPESGAGLVWAAVRPGTTIERASTRQEEPRSTVVQATNLGISVKDSPQNTLVFVTSLDSGTPVAGATVSIVNTDNTRLWRATTNADGIAMAPPLPLRAPDNYWEFRFIVTAEKDGDIAYVGSDWNEGIQSWDFDLPYNIDEAEPVLRGSVFTDRGVYKPGEDIHFKAIVRADSPSGIRLLPAGATLRVRTTNSRDQLVDEREVRVNDWSSTEWTWTPSTTSALGNYRTTVQWPGGLENREWLREIDGSFLVAAYRKPDFRVTAAISMPAAVAGEPIDVAATANYLFGSAVAQRPVRWSVTKTRERGVPPAITERYAPARFAFGPINDEPTPAGPIAGDEATTDAQGRFSTRIDSDAADRPYRYTFEAEVEDVSRQRIANRATVVAHPASFYIGLGQDDYFVTAGAATTVDVVAAALNGQPVVGIPVSLELFKVQWNSVRVAEGNGFYRWETTRTDTPVGTWTVTTTAAPAALAMTVADGGSYLLRATARDEAGRPTMTEREFYGLGDGYTAWQRFDHNRITLTPEQQTWKPGDRARIMIESPWESATALLTVEREGIRSHERFTLTSTQQTVEVPISEGDIPNIFVSVLLIRGRTSNDFGADGSDPGKPAFRLGYTELKVEDAGKRLAVTVAADRAEYRPANTAQVSLTVTDASSRPARSEVTLWAVDFGVLSLTDYNAPDVLKDVYREKSLQVMNSDSRQRVVSRRVLTPKGGDEGGGGGADGVRQDFRPLAFWVGSVVTDANGRAVTTVTLPEALTTYRIMAVAGDASSRFGLASTEITVSKPVTLLATFPRFLRPGDAASFGAVVTNTLAAGGDATVTIRSLTPELVEVTGPATQERPIGAASSADVRFAATAHRTGLARVQISVSLGANTDAFESTIPVIAPAPAETVAAFAQTTDTWQQPLQLPEDVTTSVGGLTIDWASTALVGLGGGVDYLVNYPYACAEQKASAAFAFLLAADLGNAFSVGAVPPADYRSRATQLLDELPSFQCGNGGFGLWSSNCFANPYLTAYILHVFRTARDLGVAPDQSVIDRALDYLESQLAANTPPGQVEMVPVWAASQAFGVKVLAEWGRKPDSHITRLAASADRMPLFALSYLLDAMRAVNDRSARYQAVLARITNGLRVEGDEAFVQELNPDALGWIWHTNARATSLVLEGLVRRGDGTAADEPGPVVPAMVRWLLGAQRNGHWGDTQSNVTALEAMVAYYRAFERDVPDMTATATLGTTRLGTATFRGRSTVSQQLLLAMPDLLRAVSAGSSTALTLGKTGTGRLYGSARLTYTPSVPPPARDQGMRVERRYERFVENGDGAVGTEFAPGDLVRVVLRVTTPQARRFVAVVDSLPAGFEPVDGFFRTTASDLAREASVISGGDEAWWERWERGGFDHIEKHDDRVQLFATRLSDGTHEFSYLVRATMAGTFAAAGPAAELMYAPEVNGRAAPTTVIIR
jgi:alpha-2-macroglobulin